MLGWLCVNTDDDWERPESEDDDDNAGIEGVSGYYLSFSIQLD